MEKSATHEVELNFFYMYYNDAKKLVELAKKERSKLKSFYARHAILSVVFASEAIINRVLDEFFLPVSGKDLLESLGLRGKWYVAPLVCGKENPAGKTYNTSEEHFQSFSELVNIRNWLVHPKAAKFVDASTDDASTITIIKTEQESPWVECKIEENVETEQEIPWVDTIKGKMWPHMRIPVNPFELTAKHAQKALEVLDAMIKELKDLLKDVITDDWLWEIDIRPKQSGQSDRITVTSLWGGYTPKSTP